MRALTLAALAAGAIAGLVACASILGIEDASFAELAEGGSLSDAIASGGAEAGDDAALGLVDGGLDGPTPCTPCTSARGERCAGNCLGTQCGMCPCGTKNIASTGTVDAPGGGAIHLLTDGNVGTSWAPLTAETTQDAYVLFSSPRAITRVAIYGPRAILAGSSPAKSVQLQLLHPDGPSATLTPDDNGDVVWDVAVTSAAEVRLTILATQGDKTPAVSEIEICGE